MRALTSTLHWFETELLTHEETLVGLRAVNRELLAQAEMATRADRIVLDMDSSESPVHGAQEGSASNGHFASVCYHPLFLFNDQGDCLAASLRPGNVPSADDWDDLLMPEIARQQGAGRRSSNATWTMPFACRRTRRWSWRSKTSSFVRRDGQAASRWCGTRVSATRRRAGPPARRIVAKVEHHRGALFPRVGFIVTNMVLPSRSVVRFYNKRGTAEQWIKEGQQATHWTRLSCHRFRANEVRLQRSVLAYNLGNLWRRLVLPPRIKRWSLTSLQQRLVKTGGRLVKHARYYWLLLAEGHLTRRLFGDMLRRIWALPVPAGGRAAQATQSDWRRNGPRVERCLSNAGKTGPPVDRTSPRAELTASEEGRCCGRTRVSGAGRPSGV